jgi:hypothetical protein
MPFGIITGNKAVTAAGTAERLVSTSTKVKKVWIQCESDNTENVAIGDANVNATAGSERGFVMDSLQSIPLEDVDLYEIYVDADTNGDGVTWFALL